MPRITTIEAEKGSDNGNGHVVIENGGVFFHSGNGVRHLDLSILYTYQEALIERLEQLRAEGVEIRLDLENIPLPK